MLRNVRIAFVAIFTMFGATSCDRSGAFLNPNANVVPDPDAAAALSAMTDETASALGVSSFVVGQLDAGSISVARGALRDTLAFEAMNACFVDAATSVHCFGRRPTDLEPIVDVGALPFYGATSAIAAMNDAFCALSASGRVECVGRGTSGQIGDGDLKDQSKPRVVLEGAVQIAAGIGHACARLFDGRLACWGSDVRSAPETKNDHACDSGPCLPKPVFFPLKSAATSIAAGPLSVCAIEKNESVECFGTSLPKNLPPLKDLALGGHSACALSKAGDVWCWGKNDVIQTGVEGPDRDAAIKVPLSGKVLEIATTGVSTCARLASNAVQCWGANALGQLGRGSATPGKGFVPGVVALSGPARALSGGQAFCAALDHSIACWGPRPWSLDGAKSVTDPQVDGRDFSSRPVDVPELATAR
jgi:hypothetical protein